MPFNLLSLRDFSNLLRLEHPSSYFAKIRLPVKRGLHTEAQKLKNFTTPRKPDKYAFPSLLKSSASLLNLKHGKAIHAAIVEMGLRSDPYIASSLINMYVKCGSLSHAVHVFVGIPERDATVWNSMVDGFFHHGRRWDGLSCFLQMQFSGIRPDGYSLSILLGACSDYSDLGHGRQIHAYLVKNIWGQDPFLGATLIDMYSKCGQVTSAHQVFDMVVEKNVYIWNTMIGGFCRSGLWEDGLELFELMKSEDCEVGSATFSSILTACSSCEAVAFGEAVHCDVVKTGFESDPYVSTSLLAMYAKCTSIDNALRVFDGVPNKRIGLWNSMIAAYAGTGRADEALEVFNEMRRTDIRPDSFTISNILSACSMIGLHDFGKGIHSQSIKRPDSSNAAVQSSLLNMYTRCGNIEDASAVFSSIEEKDMVAWGSMIAGLCQNKRFEDALGLVKQMEAKGLKLDSAVTANLVCACARLGCVELGCQLHGYAVKSGMGSDVFVGSALIDMYAKSGLLESARNLFSGIPCKNLVVWNSMIAGYSRNGQLDRSIDTFARISQYSLTPDSVSVTNVLVVVSSLAALLKGKMIHGYQVRNEIRFDMHVANALLDMYIKCGCLQYARHISERMPVRSVVTWNSMISGYGSHGHCLEAIRLFEEMQRSEVMPDEITFIALISSCSHSGLVDDGLRLFGLMNRSYGIVPRMEHYANVVDLLGRAGHLNEAYGFIRSMPIEPDERVWLCLLCASRAHRHVELGELAAEHLLKLEPERGGNHIQLLNLYGEAGLFDKAASIRVKLKEEGLKKNPGCSWIEVKNEVVVFFSGDSSSPLTKRIHDVLISLGRNLREEDVFP